MNSINKNCINEIIIKNSRFISLIFKINNIEDVHNYLNSTKLMYKDATHYCYAYILENNTKTSDDGEPSSTAGIPILNVLQNNNLTNVLCVVVRYFGKIKLGASGLIRAYSKSTREVLKRTNIIELIKGINYKISFNYEQQKDIDYILNESMIISKDYNELVTYEVNSNLDTYNILLTINKIKLKKIKEVYIEKNL